MPYKPTIRISTHPGAEWSSSLGLGSGSVSGSGSEWELEFEFGFTVNGAGFGSLQCVSEQQKNGKREGKIAKIP